MALLVDGSVSRIEDLTAYDSGVQGVASGESIDLDRKLEVALAEVSDDVETFLRWEDTGTLAQVRVSLSLKRWHTLQTLEAVYRDAYFSQLNDRYKERWKHYQQHAAEQRRHTFENGVELVLNPVYRPAAVTVTIGDGTHEAATYWIQATALDASGRESAPCEVQVVSSAVPHELTVALAYVPDGVVAWNVYVGTSADGLALQTSSALAATETWTLPDGGLISGVPPGTGQAADSVVRSSARRRG